MILLAAAGIKKKGLHWLRHTFASSLVNGIKQALVSPWTPTLTLPPRPSGRQPRKWMGCWGRGCHEKDSRGWYAAVSAPEFDPNPGKNGMGQIWVRTKNHPGAEKLWGGSLLSVLAKKQCWLHSNCRNGDGRCWRCPTKNERKPQVTKPGVFGCGGRI